MSEGYEGYEAAAKRVTFHLTYGYSTDREFLTDELTGPNIPCSYHPEQHTGSGLWSYGDPLDSRISEEEAVKEFFKVAIREVIHEGLEWFKVDGKPLIDPHHRDFEDQVHLISSRVGEELLALVEGS